MKKYLQNTCSVHCFKIAFTYIPSTEKKNNAKREKGDFITSTTNQKGCASTKKILMTYSLFLKALN